MSEHKIILATDTKQYDVTDVKLNKTRILKITEEFNKRAHHWYFEKQNTIPLPRYTKIESDEPIKYSGVSVVSQMAVKRDRKSVV